MEAYSVEDKGEGIQFNVFCYNTQPGVCIDYYDGRSWLDGETPPPADDSDEGDTTPEGGTMTYVLNTNSKKIHLPECRYAENNYREETNKTKEELLTEGYSECGICNP